MKFFSISYWLNKVLLSLLFNEQSKNGYRFVSGNEIKNSSMPSAIENTNPVLFNPILNNSGVTSGFSLDRIKRQSHPVKLKSKLINQMTKQQISWFTEKQIQAMTEKQIQAFTAEQIQCFSEEQRKRLALDQTQKLLVADINKMNVQNKSSIIEHQLNLSKI